MPQLTEEKFGELLQERLGDHWDRALAMFREYGERQAVDVAGVLWYAAEQGRDKIEEIVTALEEFNKDTLRYIPPEMRGVMLPSAMGGNKTHSFWVGLYEDRLGVRPNAV